MTILGLISDTHGLLREEAVLALRGSDLILHAGDVGAPEILESLKTVAPVVAVRGSGVGDGRPIQTAKTPKGTTPRWRGRTIAPHDDEPDVDLDITPISHDVFPDQFESG